MELDLKNLFHIDSKVIVITGATGLLGVKHAEAVAAYGGNPVLLDLSKDLVIELANRLNREYGVKATGYSVDITDEFQIKKNAQELIKKYGRIDGLVNNACNNPKVEDNSEKNFSRLENFTLDSWNKDISVGLTGAFLCSKYYGYKISKNNNGGSIVNISSDLGLIAPDQRLYANSSIPVSQQSVKPVTYSVVKTGIIGLTRYIATYWAERNVRCNAICPGGVNNGQPQDFLEKVQERIPMKRLAASNEYQGTLLWMLSNASSYLNGAIVPVEGGRTVW
ncbi:SDR family oxidoreductase [Verrucomicrobia bacterium]|nr:SDR family oxidoreductase [Verrucomicrobiota bacterium]